MGTTILTVSDDLVDQTTLANALTGMELESWVTTILPSLTSNASDLIRKHCNRFFNLRSGIEELITLDSTNEFLTNEFPVQSIDYLMANPTCVLQVQNLDTVTNQRATVVFNTTGDTVNGLNWNGITLNLTASGVVTSVPLTFATYPTVGALAAAIVALGASWSATITPNYQSYATADLRGSLSPMPARNAFAPLSIHVDDVAANLDPKTGIVSLQDDAGDVTNSYHFGPYVLNDRGYGGFQQIRCGYTAGWNPIPGDVVDACIATVKDMIFLLTVDERSSSEKDGEYSFSIERDLPHYALPRSAVGKLARWINHRA